MDVIQKTSEIKTALLIDEIIIGRGLLFAILL